MTHEPPRIAGPVAQPKKPRTLPPPGAWDSHAHVFGPADKFPYTPGRGYTPPDAPVEKFVALLDHNGCAHGLVVQGNAHGYDNRVVLDALTRYPAAAARRRHYRHAYCAGNAARLARDSACAACAFI